MIYFLDDPALNQHRCLTVEIITKFAFGRDIDMIGESDNSFEAEFLDTFDAAAHTIVDMAFAPTFHRLKFILPMPILTAIDKNVANLLKLGDVRASLLPRQV